MRCFDRKLKPHDSRVKTHSALSFFSIVNCPFILLNRSKPRRFFNLIFGSFSRRKPAFIYCRESFPNKLGMRAGFELCRFSSHFACLLRNCTKKLFRISGRIRLRFLDVRKETVKVSFASLSLTATLTILNCAFQASVPFLLLYYYIKAYSL